MQLVKMVMDRFYFSNGESAGSLEEFLRVLKKIDDECFFSHVNEQKNDFANWIRVCVKDKALSNKVRKMNDQDKIIEAIHKKLKFSSCSTGRGRG